MCYLEGYFLKEEDEINEPLWSDRHFKDALTWIQLSEENRYQTYAGKMKANENIAFLPKRLIGLKNNRTTPVFAQFDYRMMCQPLNRDIPLNRYKVVNELALRIPYKKRMKDLFLSKASRFVINPLDQATWKNNFVRYGLSFF